MVLHIDRLSFVKRIENENVFGFQETVISNTFCAHCELRLRFLGAKGTWSYDGGVPRTRSEIVA